MSLAKLGLFPEGLGIVMRHATLLLAMDRRQQRDRPDEQFDSAQDGTQCRVTLGHLDKSKSQTIEVLTGL